MNSMQSRQSTLCVLFQPAHMLYVFSILRDFQAIKALAKTTFKLWNMVYKYNGKFERHACKLLKHALKTNSIQSRQSTSCVLFQPAYIMWSLCLREFQTIIKVLAKTTF
jgi:hypothetical protein